MFSVSGFPLFWLLAMILFLIVEAIVPGLVSIWFAGGALVALIAAEFGAPIWLQAGLFGVVSVALLLATRPLAKKYINSKVQPTNADMIIGKECIVRETIDNVKGTGAVLAGGKTWSAVSCDDGIVIPVDSRAVVESIRGVKAVVRPLENQ